ncbi:MAG: acyl transferase [Bacteroidales bacterium]|nr:acyl transferase [Bacteroidales bacterium]
MSEYYPDFESLFTTATSEGFKSACLGAFRYQNNANPVYKQFCDLLGIRVDDVIEVEKIPFLPVELFRTHKIQCGKHQPEKIFTSSGTTGQATSKHYVTDLLVYNKSLLRCFEMNYGPVSDYCILALLPSYLEREGSSLVYMIQNLMQQSGHADNGFYLYDHHKLAETIEKLVAQKQKTILIGVSFALLDFSEKHPIALPENFIVMETGGMKGRRREMVREELHEILGSRFQIPVIHSEYGMTELLSQAYSKGKGFFRTPPWMKILIRDLNDPFRNLPAERTGAINIIDLANIHSCSFISTQDLGRINDDETFEVLGRFDNSDVKGCNLMVQ